MTKLVKRQTPVSQQIILIIEKRLRDGFYQPGDRLPAESELSSEFGVSRASLRTALAKLETAGLILRKHGEGTYASSQSPDNNGLLGAIWQFDHLIRIQGKKPSIKVISIQKRPAFEDEARKLRLDDDGSVVATERLFFANDDPVILTNDIFPIDLFSLSIEQVDFNHPIGEILEKYCDQEIAYSNAKIEAILSSEKINELLKLNPITPLLCLKEVFFNRREDRPIFYAISYINTSAINLYQNRPWY